MRRRIYRHIRARVRRNRRDCHKRGERWCDYPGGNRTYIRFNRARDDLHGWRYFRRTLNPAVSLGFFAARRFPLRDVIPYIVSQCAGAFAASSILRLLFPKNATLGATLPAGSAMQSFVLELILTAILMFVILSVSTGSAEKGITAGIAVGSVIGLEAMFAGPICGASMNPARSLAPAVVSQHLSSLWIYLVAPVIGALVAVVGCRCVREEGCCSIPCSAAKSES
jgi:aquaporin NIP